MKTALHGIDGDELTLPQYLRVEGHPDKWKIQPICKGCEQEVTRYDTAGAFKFAAHEFGQPRASIGFRHKRNSDADGCDYSHKGDIRFATLTDTSAFRKEMIEVNRAVLAEGYNRELNRKVITVLWNKLTGSHEFPEQDIRDLTRDRSIYGFKFLRSHPWIFPYLLAVHKGHAERIKPDGTLAATAFQSVGYQKVKFRNAKGEIRIGSIPQNIQPCWVNESDAKAEYVPFINPRTGAIIEFELSEIASRCMKPVRKNSIPAPQNRDAAPS